MTRELSKRQRDAADLLARGENKTETGKKVGVSRLTIKKWTEMPKFQEYFNNVIAEIEAVRSRAATVAIVKEEFDRRASLEEWRIARIEANKRKLLRGNQIIDKITERLNDLPGEAFGVNVLAPLLKAGDEMVETALNGWGEAIDVEGAKPTHTNEIAALQQLVDGGILPQASKEEISTYLDEFQQKAITALSSANASLSGKVSSAQNLP